MILKKEDVELFWGGPFSQWYIAEFTAFGLKFNCAEQFMMLQKARLFHDYETERAILAETSPREQKLLGRQVKNFDDNLWKSFAETIVREGNLCKFFQNEDLKQILLDTGDKMLVEASPYDKIWGIGLSKIDPDCLDTDKWQGTNLLGKVLMDVRKILKGQNE